MTNSKRKELETKAIQDNIDHWTRMIDWVKTQPKNNWTNSGYMDSQINELWHSSDCALCKIYKYKYELDCNKCPLYISGNDCGNHNSIWKKIGYSSTWKEWLYWAYRMRATLKRLLK